MTDKQDDIQNTPVGTNPLMEKYLTSGAHIGARFKSGDMGKYIYKQRRDGLKVLDIQMIDQRVKHVGQFLSRYAPHEIIVVSRKMYGKTPVEEFAATIGCRALTGRFVPGTFTNPEGKEFLQPKVVIITEPESDVQAIQEASLARAAVVALASTNNELRNIDVVLPVNNKGRKSLALIYWLLARGYLIGTGKIADEESFTRTPEEFEHPVREGDDDGARKRRPRMGGNGGRGRGRFSRYDEAASG
ncbi:MAG: 30S ribosomal protein S2 [Candidatus Diapherotrites archaeon]|nr:30S ribosomal protein S2 [Candidatus Diapherotrites archaeon]MDZ4256802.1 30S ribosomal protein S2 [archaeon]